MITPPLGNASLREEASKAAVMIGEKIVGSDPKSVADAMTKVLAVTRNEEIAKRANESADRADEVETASVVRQHQDHCKAQ